MAVQSWSITITGSPATFVPDAFGQTGALKAQNGDSVSWNNQTEEPHQIYQFDATTSPPTVTQITEPIEKWGVSAPAFVVATANTPGTIAYFCFNHPKETGTIEVVA